GEGEGENDDFSYEREIPAAVGACEADSGSICETDELKDSDLNEWLTAEYMLKQLPQAKAKIDVDAITVEKEGVQVPVSYYVEVTVYWSDFKNTSSGDSFGSSGDESFTYSSIIRAKEGA
ncbi:MAG: hypothetical protein D6B27_05150, partial [Gammaproteobacteria bacterium]